MFPKEDLHMSTKKSVAILKCFYAVTISRSLYLAKIYGDKDVPFLRKIANGGGSGFPVGGEINNGSMLAIARQLRLFIPEGGGIASQNVSWEREITLVNTFYWRGKTSDVVALFLWKKDALVCLKEQDLVTCDPRWEKQTIKVLERVGTNHPFCSISTNMPDFWLISPEKWK